MEENKNVENNKNMKYNCEYSEWKNPKIILAGLIFILIAVIVIVSILREKIVSENSDITTIIGHGKISYQPDIAVLTLGVKVDKAATASEALEKMNSSINGIILAVEKLGIAKEDILTQTYSLSPHYDYRSEEGTTVVSGYDANQKLTIKIRGIDKDSDLTGKVIKETSILGTNQISGVSFNISNIEELKQQARIEAIKDAKIKSSNLAKAAGIKKLGKVVSWYENIIKSPGAQDYNNYGLGGSGEKIANVSVAQTPGGTGEIIIEMSLNYRIK